MRNVLKRMENQISDIWFLNYARFCFQNSYDPQNSPNPPPPPLFREGPHPSHPLPRTSPLGPRCLWIESPKSTGYRISLVSVSESDALRTLNTKSIISHILKITQKNSES